MKKSGLALMLALCLCLTLLSGCGFGRSKAEFYVLTATDLHLIAPELTDHGPFFTRMIQEGDGKLTEYSDEIADAFLDRVIELEPEALILTGDLSFNGAPESHRCLAEKLSRVEKAGIRVLVLPGNHDVYCRNAARFEGDGFERIPSADSDGFREIYAEFGFAEAVLADTDSLSYMAEINENTWALMLDTNTAHDPCGLSRESLRWIERALGKARRNGVTVLAAGHQNLYQHSLFSSGYVIEQHEELAALFRRYGVNLFLSGHMHIQHILTESGLTEIATSALSLSPCHYGVLKAEDGAISYRAEELDVSSWALKQGKSDGNLLRFKDYADQAMDRRALSQSRESLEGRGYSEEELEELSRFAAALNAAYFAGDLREIPSLDPEGALLRRWKDSGTVHGWYLGTLEEEIGKSYLSWSR